MYQYHIYGLNISSTRQINLLNEFKFSDADLEVCWEISSFETLDNTLNWQTVRTDYLDKIDYISLSEAITEDGTFTKVCFIRDDGKNLNFLINPSKTKLWICHHVDEHRGNMESYFVGAIMSFTLRMREVICLHASVVGIDGMAIAFMGYSTSGKSTIAAGLADAGADILADDVAVLHFENDKFLVQPGYSKVRLRPKAAEFLTENPEDLPWVYSFRDSRYFSLENGKNFQPKPLPLTAIYVLGKIHDNYKKPFLKPIESKNKLIKLLPNTMGSYAVRGDLRAKEFEALSQIAKTIPMRQLHYAHDISTLPKQCELIFKDFSRIKKNSKVLANKA